jgi:hypothetical protein
MSSIPFKRILLWAVLLIHGLFLFSLFLSPAQTAKRHQRMRVQAVRPNIPAPKIATAPAPKPKPKAIAKPTEAQRPQTLQTPPPSKQPILKQNKKTAPSKANANTPSSKSKKAAAPSPKKQIVSDDLLQELEQNIAKMETKPVKQKALTPLATAARPIELSSTKALETSILETSNEELKELLVQELQSMLHLPEHGEVKMRLVIRSDGSLREINVLKTASKKNEAYLQSELPKHIFSFLANPCLKEKDHTFVITFCSEKLFSN